MWCIDEDLIIGIDPSLTSTGVAVIDWNGRVLYAGCIGSVKLRGVERLYDNRSKLVELLERYSPFYSAVIEDYSYHSRGRGLLDIAEWVGIIKIELYLRNIEFLAVAPAVLKKFVTGHGNATDTMMAIEGLKRFGWDFHIADEIDACGLAEFGRRLTLLRQGDISWHANLSPKQKEVLTAQLKKEKTYEKEP